MSKKNIIIAIALSTMLVLCASFRVVDANQMIGSGRNLLIGQDKNNTMDRILENHHNHNHNQDEAKSNDSNDLFAETLGNRLIRFHVVANSDSKQDQSIKLSIRDAILKDIGPEMEKLKTRQECIDYLEKNLSSIESIANHMLIQNNKTYQAKAQIGKFLFPIKSYGEITLPEGRYTALKVVLGRGEGKNWWCVMFPPLCFIDITRGLASKESNSRLSNVLSKNEMKKIANTKDMNSKINKNSQNQTTKVVFRFKAVEILKRLFK